MAVLIIIIGVLTFLAGVGVLIRPDFIFSFLQRQQGKMGLYVLNVVARVFFGVVLIFQSDISRFSFVVEIIGWFCIAIAIILMLIGREHFNQIIAWAFSLLETHSRISGVLILTFGAFLMYAFV